MVSTEKSEKVGAAGAHFKLFFYVLFTDKILIKKVLAVSHLTVTLQMMSENHRSSPVITAHLPIDQQAEDNGLIAESLK